MTSATLLLDAGAPPTFWPHATVNAEYSVTVRIAHEKSTLTVRVLPGDFIPHRPHAWIGAILPQCTGSPRTSSHWRVNRNRSKRTGPRPNVVTLVTR